LSAGFGVELQTYPGSWVPVPVVEDYYTSIENLTGSSHDDSLTGDANANVLDGGAGNDLIHGGGGNDTLIGGTGVNVLDGGAGIDTVDYSNAAHSVSADLRVAAGNEFETLANGHQLYSHDTYISIENLTGSSHDDFLQG